MERPWHESLRELQGHLQAQESQPTSQSASLYRWVDVLTTLPSGGSEFRAAEEVCGEFAENSGGLRA